MKRYSDFITESKEIKSLTFILDNEKYDFIGTNREILRKLSVFVEDKGYVFDKTYTEDEVNNKIKFTKMSKSSFFKLPISGKYIGGFDNANNTYLIKIANKWLSNIGNVSNIQTTDSDQSIDNQETPQQNTQTIEKMRKENPFRQAICILGDSGVGKSFRVRKTLEKAGHNYIEMTPNAMSTNLLAQYKTGQGYVLSKLGKLIIEAQKNPSQLYTVFMDECHKIIDSINDELLQCISTKRNDGVRFISLDDVTDELFQDLPTRNGIRILPDNFGFIFASSKEEIVKENPDFKSRMEFLNLTKEDRGDEITHTVEFLKKKIESVNERFTY